MIMKKGKIRSNLPFFVLRPTGANSTRNRGFLITNKQLLHKAVS